MKKIEILPVTKKDLKELAQIYIKIWRKLGEDWEIKTAENFLEDYFKSFPDLMFKAVSDNKIVGGAMAKIKPWFLVKMSDTELFVLPEYRNKKIGKKLAKTLIEAGIKNYKAEYFEGIADGKEDFPLKWYERIGIKRTRYIHIEGKTKDILKNLLDKK